jgi:uncharacterized protein YdcH (DUF465 family)
MENVAQEELKAHLIETDEHFRELARKHHEYDHRLEELEAKHPLTGDEQLEEVRLKKLKLHLKDQMAAIMSRHKPERVH